MGRQKKLKTLISTLRDKATIIKETLTITNRTTSYIRIAVLRATTRSSLSPPPDHRISAILSLGHATRPTASACVSVIMDRLHDHHGRSASVALKSLMTLHNIITKGSFILKDQLSFYPSSGGLNSLNLSRFMDKTDLQSRELSSWVRWYAGFLESNLSTSRVLGSYFSSFSSSLSKSEIEKLKENLVPFLNSDLFRELNALVAVIEEICRAPKSLHCRKNDIVYEIMRLVGEDYRMTQYYTMIRLTELKDRMGGLSPSELDELTRCLKRLNGCKERLTELFVNRKRHDAFWELESEVMSKLEMVKKEREMEEMMSRRRIKENNESTQLRERLIEASQQLSLLPLGEAKTWLSIDRVNLNASTAMV